MESLRDSFMDSLVTYGLVVLARQEGPLGVISLVRGRVPQLECPYCSGVWFVFLSPLLPLAVRRAFMGYGLFCLYLEIIPALEKK